MLSCISAAVQVPPPMIVYTWKQRVPDPLRMIVHLILILPAVGMDGLTVRFFLKHISPARPMLLVQDVHCSHISVSLIELAFKNDVHLL